MDKIIDSNIISDSCEYIKNYIAMNDIFSDEVRQHIWYIYLVYY